jgi:hypothetical protein
MEQRDVEIGADQQSQADLTQIAALLRVVPSLRKVAGSTGVDVGLRITSTWSAIGSYPAGPHSLID